MMDTFTFAWGGTAVGAVCVDVVASALTDRALQQARAPQPPKGTKGHVQISSEFTMRELPPEIQPSRDTRSSIKIYPKFTAEFQISILQRILFTSLLVYFDIGSEESMMAHSTAEILVAPRMPPTISDFGRQLTPSEFQNMTYNV